MLPPDLLDISAPAHAAIIDVHDFETINTCPRPPSLMSITPGYEISGVMGDQSMPSSGLSAVHCCLGKASIHSSCSAEHAVMVAYYLTGRKHLIIIDVLAAHLHKLIFQEKTSTPSCHPKCLIMHSVHSHLL